MRSWTRPSVCAALCALSALGQSLPRNSRTGLPAPGEGQADCATLREQMAEMEKQLADPALARDEPELYRTTRDVLAQMKRAWPEICGPGAGAGRGTPPQPAFGRPQPSAPLSTAGGILGGLAREALRSRPALPAPPPASPIEIPVATPRSLSGDARNAFRSLDGSGIDDAFVEVTSNRLSETDRSQAATRPAQWVADLIAGNFLLPGGQWVKDILERRRVAPGGPFINLVTGEYVLPGGARIHDRADARNPHARAQRLADFLDPRILPGQQWLHDLLSLNSEVQVPQAPADSATT